MILKQNVVNKDNSDSGASGGKNTKDNIYLLSISEVANSDYGFCEINYIMSASRWIKANDYAHMMGAYTDDGTGFAQLIYEGTKGNCNWDLRSPGSDTSPCAYVSSDGVVDWYRKGNETHDDAILPVLNLKLSSDLWYSVNDGSSGSGGEDNPGEDSSKVTKISIQVPSSKLAAGKKVKLTAKITPSNAANKNVKWKSSNTKYASIDKNGKLTLKKTGAGKTVTITATAQDGSGKKATCKIKLMKHAVKSIKLTAPSKNISVGRTMKLKATVKTTGNNVNKSISWSSSNSKYATVDKNGKVKTKKAGKGKTVTITAQSTDGTNKKATIKLTIK